MQTDGVPMLCASSKTTTESFFSSFEIMSDIFGSIKY